jgi:hypothetical protein
MTRTRFGTRLAAALILMTLPLTLHGQKKAAAPKPAAPPAKVAATVYLSPTCGCCSKWADHMQEAGFVVKREVTAELDSVPARQRVPEPVRSCHTAVIGKYLVEGHVPADVVRQLLRDQPNIAGIAVPGMPIGSPGMEGPNPRSYSIIAFKADGSTYEFARR